MKAGSDLCVGAGYRSIAFKTTGNIDVDLIAIQIPDGCQFLHSRAVDRDGVFR